MPPAETATTVLRDEHKWILRVVAVLAGILSRSEDDGDLDYDSVDECVTFFRLFADACHHGKEEDLLFPELESRGMPHDSGPIAVMLHEHRQGRAYVKHMADALPAARGGDEQARKIVVNAARGYMDLIRGHIAKEDQVLFHMADQMVGGPACRKLCDAYGVVCARHFEGHTKAELEALAGRLEERNGLGAA